MIFNRLFNSHTFVFNLFLENKLSLFYTPYILNTLSKKSFKTTNTIDNEFKKIYLVKDIPDYLSLTLQKTTPNILLKTVSQYKGYLINVSNFESVDDYINTNLNRRNKKNLNSKKSKLYSTHNISSKFYFGTITENEYDAIFKTFYNLLKIRFSKKKTYNRYLSNWNKLQASTFQKIQDKKVSLHVIYDDLKPIAITLNFHLNDIVFSHIQTYDVNYSKYNMGDICIVNHIEWLIHNKIAIFDLSMGHTYYKEKWCNHHYHFFYHIFYSKESILSRLFAKIIALELKLLQFLRNKNVIGKLFMFDKLLYTYKSKVVRP